MSLKGFLFPRTHTGVSSLIPNVPWHYSGDLLTLEYRTNPDRVAELLPDGIELADEDPGAPARVMKDFAEENDEFEIKALSVGGKLLEASQIDVLAKLPTLDQARSVLMSVMLAPVTKLALLMNEVPSKVTRAVAAVRDQKQEAA